MQNFALNFKEKLYLLIFATRIRPKYLQNLRMVLSILCKDDKIDEKNNCLRYFGVNVRKVLLPDPTFFGKSAHWDFEKFVVILSVIPAVSSSAERSFSVLRRPKIKFRGNMGQDRLSHLAPLSNERAYVNRVDIEKVIDEFA